MRKAQPARSTRLTRLVHASALAVPFVVGCTSIDSSDIRTNGVHPDMLVSSSSDGPGSNVVVMLHVGDSLTDFVELAGEDKLSLTAGDETKDLVEQKVLGTVSYHAPIATQEPGDEIVIQLSRGEEDEDAPASTVTLGAKLTLTSPAPGGASSRANDDIVVSWTSEASGDAVAVDYNGSCIQGGTRAVQSGETSVTLARGSILKREPASSDEAVPDECEMAIVVRRTHAGTLDPAFGGGRIRHEYTASAKLTSKL